MLDCIRGGAKPVNKLLKPRGIVLITGMSTQSLIYVGRKLGMNKKRKSDRIDCKFSKRFLIQWQLEAEKEIEQDYGRHEKGVFIIQPHVIFFSWRISHTWIWDLERLRLDFYSEKTRFVSW